MLRHKISITLFISVLILGACKKNFLEVPDKDILLRQAYVVNLETTSHYLNGVFIKLGSEFFTGYNAIYPELIADNIKPLVGVRNLNSHYSWKQEVNDVKSSPTGNVTSNMNFIWNTGHRLLYDCNYIIGKSEEYKDENLSRANEIRGQALTIKAMVNFVLVNTFAQAFSYTPDGSHIGIPLVKSSNWTDKITRANVKEVYEAMINDLKLAITLLPDANNNARQINLNGAKGLLSRVYLFKGDYLNAKNTARELGIKVPLLTGADYPSKLFTIDETEALFQLTPSWNTASTGAGQFDSRVAGLYFAELLQFVATNEIALLLNDTLDFRHKWIMKSGTNWMIKKFPSKSVTGFPLPSLTYYHTLIRSSEMFLIAAESYANLNNEDSARFFLDAIRLRARPGLLKSTATGAALLDSIYLERRKELAFEGLRMYDLQRIKKPVIRTDASNPSATLLPYPSNKSVAPIPLSDVDLAGMPQNLEY